MDNAWDKLFQLFGIFCCLYCCLSCLCIIYNTYNIYNSLSNIKPIVINNFKKYLPSLLSDGINDEFIQLSDNKFYYIFTKPNRPNHILFNNIDLNNINIKYHIMLIHGGGGGGGGHDNEKGCNGLGGNDGKGKEGNNADIQLSSVYISDKLMKIMNFYVGKGGKGGQGGKIDLTKNINLPASDGEDGESSIFRIDNKDFIEPPLTQGGYGGKAAGNNNSPTYKNLTNVNIDPIEAIIDKRIKYSGSGPNNINNLGSGGLGGNFNSNGQNGKDGCIILELTFYNKT